MKRIAAVLLSVVLLVTGVWPAGTVQASPVESENLVKNGSYEIVDSGGKAESWITWAAEGTPVFSVDDAVYKEGSRSLKISADAPSRGAFYQRIPVTTEQRGKTYKLTQWVKTDALTGTARNRVQFKDKNDKTIGSVVYTEGIQGTQDWTLVETYVVLPEQDVVSFNLHTFFESGTGTAWYDGTTMTPWVPLEAIAFGQEDYSVAVGSTITPVVQFIPASASNINLVWTSSDESVATVQDGEIAGISDGVAIVTATSADDGAIRSSVVIYVGNLIKNGSYELLDNGGAATSWKTWAAEGNPVFTIDDTVYKVGSRSLKISADESARAALYQQKIPITNAQKGKTYKITQWVKTEGLNGAARNRIQFKDKDDKRIGPHVYTEGIQGTQDWTLIENYIVIPQHEDIVSFDFHTFFESATAGTGTATGTAWYDETTMVPWIPLEAIVFGQEEYAVAVGSAITPVVHFIPANTSSKDLVWTSSDESVATVQDGVITGAGNGLAVVTAASTDGKIRSSVPIFVGSSGDGVTAENDAVETDQGMPVSGGVKARSEQGRSLTYELAIHPKQGSVRMDDEGNWIYFADKSYYGTDSFLVLVKDDIGNYAVSRITVSVLQVNNPPAAEDSIKPTAKNQPVSGSIIATDPDGDPLSFEIAGEPNHGQVQLQADGKWSYIPDTDYTGEDLFTVRIGDGKGGEGISTVRVYMAPLPEDIVGELKTANPDRKHPRILAKNEDFTRIQGLLGTDSNMQRWYSIVKQSADILLTQPVSPYSKPDGVRLNTTASNSIIQLAFAYRLTGEQQYADRALEELLNVSSEAYPDWSPEHFLDAATMTYGVAVGYDWLYEYLSEEQRSIIREAIVVKGLTPALRPYANMWDWAIKTNNWNFVCNAGMIAGALAIADEEEEIAGTILHGAFKSLQYGLRQYAPDGSSVEGPQYWEYGTQSLVYLLSALETTFGHDFGFSGADGIEETPNYPLYIAGSRGTFNYSDSSSDAFISGKLLLWFAQRFDNPDYSWYHQFSNDRSEMISLYDMLWYRPELYGGGQPQRKDNFVERQQTVMMRSSWADPNALFAGFKGGVNGSPHGDLDIGSFILDAYGVRWVSDLGKENYNLPGYWDMSQTGTRWEYYRKRAEGHNTIVINPSGKPDQDVTAVANIVRFEDNQSQGAFAIADMTEAYPDSVISARRGFALFDHRRQFLVQDEIQAKSPSELYWFMHTSTAIDISGDGQTAILSEGDKRLQVQILSPAEASFSVMDAVSLPTSTNPAGQTANSGMKKLVIHLQNVLDTTISVRMVPLMPGQEVSSASPDVVPLDEWTISDRQIAQLDHVLLDGLPHEDFQPERYTYTVQIPYGEEYPAIEAIPVHAQHTVQVQEVTPGMYRIDVADPGQTMDSSVYFVQFAYKEERRGEPSTQTPVPGIPQQTTKLPIVKVWASADDGNVPVNVIDGNLSTRWSAEGGSWIQFDLGERKTVQEMAIAWSSGDRRSAIFDIEVSENGYVWEWVYGGQSSGTTLDFETYPLREATGRYVRIKGYGNTASVWNSIAEVSIHGSAVTEQEGEGGSGPGDDQGSGSSDSGSGSGDTPPVEEVTEETAVEEESPDGGEQSAGSMFADIGNHWAVRRIQQAAEEGWVNGYPDGGFRPDASISRSEYVVMLIRALKQELSEGELLFADKNSIGEWAAAAIGEAVRNEWVHGYEDGTFRPEAPINRAELVTILMRATGGSSEPGATSFADDADIPDWAKGFVKAAQANGSIEGREGNVFAPLADTTRAEAVALLLRLFA